MQKNFFFRSQFDVEVLDLLDTDSLATQDQAEKRETISRAIGGPVSGLVDETPSILILTMEVKKMIDVSLSFSCLSLIYSYIIEKAV